MDIRRQTILQRTNREISVSNMGNEIVMLDVENDRYIGLNGTGAVIWQRLESACTFDQLVNQLTEHFDVERQLCEEATIKYLKQMITHDLIIIENQEA